MKTVAYLRISTGSQDLANQKLAILDYAQQKRFAVDHFIEAQASSRKGRDQRRIDELLGAWPRGTDWSSASCPAWAAAWAR